ncbi:MAG TPA: tail fiber protein [Mycobacteriales bacterium]|jgi:microcystin-dependent protein|nr:tail fiber protein [Mycobacteriales bacterium]
MGDPFLGEIKMVPYNYAQQGWAMCNGSQLPINQNQALFSLLGTTYGGNGQTTFALPNLQGRVPMHFQNNAFNQGQQGGEQAHTITINELPTHTHVTQGTQNAATTVASTGNVFANATVNAYNDPASFASLAPNTIGNVGGSQPHNNMAPYTVLTFVIALQGVFPSHN